MDNNMIDVKEMAAKLIKDKEEEALTSFNIIKSYYDTKLKAFDLPIEVKATIYNEYNDSDYKGYWEHYLESCRLMRFVNIYTHLTGTIIGNVSIDYKLLTNGYYLICSEFDFIKILSIYMNNLQQEAEDCYSKYNNNDE